MPMCAMIGCSARSKSAAQKTNMEPGIGLYCLPKVITRQCGRTKALSEERRRLWLARINRKDMKNLDYVRVCGRHFISGKPASLMDDTNPDWVPSQHLGYTNGAGPGMKTTGRYERAKDRRANKAVAQQCVGTQPAEDDPPSPEMSEVNENAEQEMCAEGSSETDLVKEAAVQTVVTMEYISTLEEDRTRLASELREAEEAKKKLEVTADSLRDDPAKVAFYTGLSSFARLFAVFQMVECVVKHTQQNGLGKFQEFVVFLMKLRCNFPLQDLGYRFGVSDSTVSRIFEKWLNAAFWRLKPLISWPSRNAIQKTMPQAFLDSFGSKVAVIIDCFEVKIERPSSMEPRSETWSQYKSSNTAKYLIGISPQGVITFISEGWGGRCSDKHITENCGVLDMLTQGDLVLADRGFDIADTLGLYCVQLHVPAFTKGRNQLTALEVHNTRKLASVRIHVERVIGLVRNKYVIMKAVQPIDFVACRQDDPVPPLDKIVTVCCSLCNICPSVVPPNQKEPVQTLPCPTDLVNTRPSVVPQNQKEPV